MGLCESGDLADGRVGEDADLFNNPQPTGAAGGSSGLDSFQDFGKLLLSLITASTVEGCVSLARPLRGRMS